MDLEEMKAQLEAERAKVVELESAVEAHTKAVGDLGELLVASDAAFGALTKSFALTGEVSWPAVCDAVERTISKVKSLEDAALVAEVDGLVGKKIAPSERDVMLKLARADVAMFREATAARPDMTLLATESVLGADKSAPKSFAQDANGAELATAIFSR